MFKKYDPICDIILSTIKQAAAGDLEVRVKGFNANSKYAPIAHALNDLLDQVEVWQREIGSSISAAFSGRERNIYEAGLRGLFKKTALQLQEANRGIAASLEAAEQTKLALELEKHSKSAEVEAVLSAELERSKDKIAAVKDAAASVASGAHESLTSVQALASKSAELAELIALSADINEQLDAKASEISSVLGMVKDITDQTQLLSLNAAIEAARAGEHGRGFAVVADEVGKLASNTQDATNTISANVASLKDSVSRCVEYSRRVQAIGKENDALVEELASALEGFERGSSAGERGAAEGYKLQNELYVVILLMLFRNNLKEALLNPAVVLDKTIAERIAAALQALNRADLSANFASLAKQAASIEQLPKAEQLASAAHIEEAVAQMCKQLQ